MDAGAAIGEIALFTGGRRSASVTALTDTEGWLLDRTCTKLGLDRTDAFGLMLATCADCAGAVEIVPEAA